MNKEIIFLAQEEADGSYTAKALGEAIFTEAESIDDLKKNVREAVACHFDGDEKPDIICLRYVREEVLPA